MYCIHVKNIWITIKQMMIYVYVYIYIDIYVCIYLYMYRWVIHLCSTHTRFLKSFFSWDTHDLESSCGSCASISVLGLSPKIAVEW